VVMSAVILTIV